MARKALLNGASALLAVIMTTGAAQAFAQTTTSDEAPKKEVEVIVVAAFPQCVIKFKFKNFTQKLQKGRRHVAVINKAAGRAYMAFDQAFFYLLYQIAAKLIINV